MNTKPLAICVDMFGCPNRCAHCWLSHMPNRTMEKGADEWIVSLFKPYFDSIEFYSWLREPDFCDDYRGRWERDKALSVNCEPERFELASFWRLVRDPDYVRFLCEVGVRCVQLTFFGTEKNTDRYIRPGAFRVLMRAADILIENSISPRFQAFINEENRDDIAELLDLTETLRFGERCKAFGGSFKFFVHEGSCEGENRLLYPIRIQKGHIPERLLPYYLEPELLHSEREYCEMFKNDFSRFVPGNGGEDMIVIYVSNSFDLFFNFTHMRPEWRIGNLRTEPIEELVRRIKDEDIPALRRARAVTLSELVRRWADPSSDRLFGEDDFKQYLLNTHLERER